MSKSDRSRARLGRRAVLVGGGLSLALAGGVSLGILAGANTPSPTNVNFVSLTTPYKLFTNRAIKTTTPVTVLGLGGATKVPSNATTIEIQLSVSGSTAAGGTVTVSPAGNPSGGSGSVTWDGGESNAASVGTQIGTADDITFTDTGGPAVATASIIGYSTQVSDGDVSGLDGNTGQVLTDNGTGGASWQNPGQPGYMTDGTQFQTMSNTGPTTVMTMTLPAGSYLLNFEADAYNKATLPDDITCDILNPSNQGIAQNETIVAPGLSSDLATQGFTNGGITVTVTCVHSSVTSNVELGLGAAPTLSAVKVSSYSYIGN